MDEEVKARGLSAAREALAKVARTGHDDAAFEVEEARLDANHGQRLSAATPTAGAGVEKDAAVDASARRRLFIRMTLISDYRLSSAFIPVPKLALILGVSPSTIWSHMRQRKFPIPYRMFNTTPMVCIDDLVDWYCDKDDLILPDEAQEVRAPAKPDAQEERRRLSEETDDIVANALASLGIAPRGRRRR